MTNKIIYYDDIRYLDKNDEVSLIDFHICKKNWFDYVSSSKDFDIKDLSFEKSNGIGQRDAFKNPLYIECFSDPKIKIIFPYKKNVLEKLFKLNSKKAYSNFRKITDEIFSNGWGTLDLG